MRRCTLTLWSLRSPILVIACAALPACAAAAPSSGVAGRGPPSDDVRMHAVESGRSTEVAAAEPVSVKAEEEPLPGSSPPHEKTRCEGVASGAVRTLSEPGGSKRLFSVHGYHARTLQLEPDDPVKATLHCVTVAWPPGELNSAGQPSHVARFINPAWLRAIENTLARIPWTHARVVQRIVIDNRPKEHGIAAHDRRSEDDGRDGRTIWLHEHLFREPNHWARGNYGAYWSYHASEDGLTLDAAPPDHELFSPVLLHEIGHLVMYNIVNAGAAGPEAASPPPCAETCGDRGECNRLARVEREAGCISPYCMPFRFQTGTENWAEQYRFYYQGSTTRALLVQANAACLPVLEEQERNAARRAPWARGLPDVTAFRPSRWDSCGGRACKPW